MRQHIKINEILEYKIFDKNSRAIIDSSVIPIHFTIHDWGKEQLAKLVGGITPAYTINEMRVRRDVSAWSTISVNNSKLPAAVPEGATCTLVVEGASAFTIAGTYDFVRCSNSGAGTFYHNELTQATIELGAGGELEFSVKFAVSGLNKIGNEMTVERLGSLGTNLDVPISSIMPFINGGWADEVACTNSVSNNTLTVVTVNPFTTVGTFTYLMYEGVGDRNYYQQGAFTVEVFADQEFIPTMEFVY